MELFTFDYYCWSNCTMYLVYRALGTYVPLTMFLATDCVIRIHAFYKVDVDVCSSYVVGLGA